MGLSGDPRQQQGDVKDQVRARLREAAQTGTPVTYRDLALALGLSPPNTIHQLTELLEALMAEDATAARPFIAALVVSKVRRGLPAPGFFDCARRLDRFDDTDDALEAAAYHARELASAIAYWSEDGRDVKGSDIR